MRLLDTFRPGRASARTLRFASIALLATWTLYWGAQAVQGILTDSALGRGEFHGQLAFHHVWEVLFVAAYYFVRWLAGAVILAIAGAAQPAVRAVSRLRRRRQALSS